MTDQPGTKPVKGIGGSDIAGILGISPWATPRSVYNRIFGLAEEREAPELEWGVRHEPAVTQKFAASHPEFDGWDRPSAYGEMPFTGHPDAEFFYWEPGEAHSARGQLGILEVKTTEIYNRDEWGDPALGRAGVPPHYLCQLDWYMWLADAGKGYFAVLIGNHDYREYECPRDPAREGELVAAAKRFWDTYVLTMTPPPRTAKDPVDIDADAGAGIISANAEAEDAMFALKAALDAEAQAKDAAELARTRVKEIIGPNAGITGPGCLVTWKANKNGTRVFRAKFEETEE